ncbi:MAG TPA: hypothetical protein VG937_25965 [Polyangiaceae bacterium]|nr:hypothetical protein [Polyangiaceae bacterium]
MRLYLGEPSETERAARVALDGRIGVLFRAACSQARDAAWWRAQVRSLWPGLDGELEAERALVVRPWGRELTPIAEYVAARAPQEFTVSTRRAPLALQAALEQARRAGVELRGARARAGFARGHLLEIVVYVPGGTASPREQEVCEGLVWNLLGERCADDWVGQVRVAPAPRVGPLRVLESEPDPKQFSLSELAAAARAAIDGVRAGLAEQPLVDRDLSGEWTMFELNPEPAEDWAEEDDLVLATTCVPELLKCHLEQSPFSSLRFSRHGEAFFCLKYEAEGSSDARLALRVRVEDALERGLRERRLGRVVGAGLGLRYAYVHLAFASPLELGLAAAADIGRRLSLPRRSWLLPFDSDWADEWHEVWPGAPAPPRRAS